MTQAQQVHEYILNYGSITAWESFADLGITQLGRCVDDIQKAGTPIARDWVEITNRMGEKRRVKRYHLPAGQGELQWT